MIPQDHKIDFSKCNNRSKGYDTENCVYHKYGKDYPIKEYVQEWKDGTCAKEVIAKAGGLANLPKVNEQIKDADISIDMNEDMYTINRKMKLGKIAMRKIEAQRAEQARIEAEMAAQQPKTDGGNE